MTLNVSDFLQMICENQPLTTRNGTPQYKSTTTNPSVIHGVNSALFVDMAANVLHRFLERQFRYRTNPHDFMSRHANAVVQIFRLIHQFRRVFVVPLARWGEDDDRIIVAFVVFINSTMGRSGKAENFSAVVVVFFARVVQNDYRVVGRPIETHTVLADRRKATAAANTATDCNGRRFRRVVISTSGQPSTGVGKVIALRLSTAALSTAAAASSSARLEAGAEKIGRV